MVPSVECLGDKKNTGRRHSQKYVFERWVVVQHIYWRDKKNALTEQKGGGYSFAQSNKSVLQASGASSPARWPFLKVINNGDEIWKPECKAKAKIKSKAKKSRKKQSKDPRHLPARQDRPETGDHSVVCSNAMEGLKWICRRTISEIEQIEN